MVFLKIATSAADMNLYRGFIEPLTSIEQLNIFHSTPRTPRDTDLTIHSLADAWFLEKFGVKARSATLICSTNRSQASSYGYMYKIIPIEPFSIIYSPNVIDFYEHHNEVSSTSPHAIRDWLESKGYRQVIDIGEIDPSFLGEVMVSCLRYKATQI